MTKFYALTLVAALALCGTLLFGSVAAVAKPKPDEPLPKKGWPVKVATGCQIDPQACGPIKL